MSCRVAAVAAVAAVLAACSFEHGVLPTQGDGRMPDQMMPPIDAPRCAAVQIAAGGDHTCAISGAGELYCWGRGAEGQLGNFGITYQCVSGTVFCERKPTKVMNFPATTAVGVGDQTTCASVGGLAYCWGRNNTQQYGNSTIGDSPTPVPVTQRNGAHAYDGSGGHTCSLAGTTLSCSGSNGQGQVGNMSVIEQSAAIPVKTAVTSFSLGSQTTCAADTTGALYCWGRNVYKTIDDTMTIKTFPQLVAGITGVVAVGVGADHVCAAITGGIAKCWGANTMGQIGNGQTSTLATPMTTVNVPNVVAIDASGNHTCLRTGNGEVYCFGEGYTPTPAKILDGATAIACGASHDCAILGDGGIRCWGDQTYGQLGNNVDVATRTLTPQTAKLCP
jgi:alpha-tubulin suppressor-like RCC1 family protein